MLRLDAGQAKVFDRGGPVGSPAQAPCDLHRAGAPRLDQARDDHTVRPAQAADGDALTHRPARSGTGRHCHPLPEHRQGSLRHRLHRADDLACDVDAPCREPARPLARHDPDDMPDPQVGDRGRNAVDANRDVLRVGDAQIVDDDRTEAPDRSDDTGAADTPVPAFVGGLFGRLGRAGARAADPLVADRWLGLGPRRRRQGRRRKGRQREQAQGITPGGHAHGRPRHASAAVGGTASA